MNREQKLKLVAQCTHEINRAYCQATGDWSQPTWINAPEWQRESALIGVTKIVEGTVQSPADSHASWSLQKYAEGWVYGPVKDPEQKQHPCLVPYEQLPPEQMKKDLLFFQSVRTLWHALADS